MYYPVKSAHEVFSCSAFREQISNVIDDEINPGKRTRFLEHAAACEHCNRLYQDMRSIRQRLQTRNVLEVSQEFDFRLKSMIGHEARLMQSPMYRARLVLRDNLFHAIAVPAAAVVVLGLAMSPIELYFHGKSPVVANFTPVVTAADSAQDINYVLDTVDEETVNQGIFLNDRQYLSQPTPTLTSISF